MEASATKKRAILLRKTLLVHSLSQLFLFSRHFQLFPISCLVAFFGFLFLSSANYTEFTIKKDYIKTYTTLKINTFFFLFTYFALKEISIIQHKSWDYSGNFKTVFMYTTKNKRYTTGLSFIS